MKKNFIPTINISSIVNEGLIAKKSLSVIDQIKKASINVGFFQIVGHEINKKNINNVVKIANKFFNSSNKNKMKLAPKKWNKKNKNSYRGYFPNDVNGKEGLDIGDLEVTKRYASKLKNQYIEYIELNKSMNKKSIKILKNYYSQIFTLGETLFKCIIKIYKKDIKDSKLVFSRRKTLSTLRFNYYSNQKNQ